MQYLVEIDVMTYSSPLFQVRFYQLDQIVTNVQLKSNLVSIIWNSSNYRGCIKIQLNPFLQITPSKLIINNKYEDVQGSYIQGVQ